MSLTIDEIVRKALADADADTKKRIGALKSEWKAEDAAREAAAEAKRKAEAAEREAKYAARRREMHALAREIARVGVQPFTAPEPPVWMATPTPSKFASAAPKTLVSRLEGPVSMTEHYDRARNLHVYVLGDYHEKIPDAGCPPQDKTKGATRTVPEFVTQVAAENKQTPGGRLCGARRQA